MAWKKEGRGRGAISQVTADGRFASKAELRRWEELKILQMAGQISNLRRQVPYRLVWPENGFLIETYIADHVYTDASTGREVIEDVKGFQTENYKRKRRWMKGVFGIEIFEVKAR